MASSGFSVATRPSQSALPCLSSFRIAASISSSLIRSRRTYASSDAGSGVSVVSRWRVTIGVTAPPPTCSSSGSVRNSNGATSCEGPTSGAAIM